MNIEKDAKDSLRTIEQLRAENELLTKWLSLIAHDFKGLFSNIQFLIDAFTSESISQELFMSMLPELKQIAQKNSKTLETTFVWVKSQMSRFNLHLEDVLLISLFSELKEELDEEITSKELSIKFVGDVSLTILTDKFLLKFILKQLLDNAIKYSNKKGAIEVIAHSELNSVNITVNDNGVGMKDSIISNIGTLNGSPYKGTMDEKGAGLSLIVIHDFVELLNGQMTVFSIIDEGTSVALLFDQSHTHGR